MIRLQLLFAEEGNECHWSGYAGGSKAGQNKRMIWTYD